MVVEDDLAPSRHGEVEAIGRDPDRDVRAGKAQVALVQGGGQRLVEGWVAFFQEALTPGTASLIQLMASLVTWVRVLKSRKHMEYRTSMQPRYPTM